MHIATNKITAESLLEHYQINPVSQLPGNSYAPLQH